MRRLLLLVLLSSLTLNTLAQDDSVLTYAYTYHQPTGNRFVTGQGTFPNVETVDVLVGGPTWIVGTTSTRTWNIDGKGVRQNEGIPEWFITRSLDGFLEEVSVYQIDDEILGGGGASPTFDAVNVPPLIKISITDSKDTVGDAVLVDSSSQLTHPIPTQVGLVYTAFSGDIMLRQNDADIHRLPLKALPDARIVVNAAGQIAVYTGANDQIYRHGVLGDPIEATRVSVLEIIDDQLQVISTITLPETDVFEGISPIWADVDEDGADDLIVTVSNASVGAQIRVYRVDGSLLASGPAIGQGGRWRHQLAFGPFGPDGENELVNVLTPHIGGVVEFYRLNGDQLEIVASLPGYTSHVLGSRNLDMAVAGDFNGDGQPEIVLPTQDRLYLAGLQHGANGVTEVWRLPLDAQLTTNLAAVTLPDNTLALAAGTADNRLRVWLPAD